MDAAPLVAVIMGSKSDWDTMRQAEEMLTKFEVPHECRVLSAQNQERRRFPPNDFSTTRPHLFA